MRKQLLFRKIHKWLGLILAIQLLFWFVSGFLMSWMPINEIRGDHLLKPVEQKPVSIQSDHINQIQTILGKPVDSIKAKYWAGNFVYEIKTKNGLQLFSQTPIEKISPINKSLVEKVIEEKIIDGYQIKSMNLLNELPLEARGRELPLWQVNLIGHESPVIYVSPTTGEIVATRTNRWRLFDFVWMLHIMDYDERDDFNHPLLYITAFSAFVFTLTGFVLLFYTLKRKKK